jgi:AsmA protein
MKLLKWTLIAIGGVIVLFAAALAFIAATFDPNAYKGQAAELVKEKTQRTLTIEGDIRLMLFPKLGVHLGKTRLSEFGSDKDFAGLDDMKVSLALIPLLSKQVVVDQVTLVGLRANLVKYKDGKTNFDDLTAGGEKAAPSPKPAEPQSRAGPIKLDVDGIRISRAAVTWKDEAAKTEYAISDLEFTTGHVAPGVPTKFELSAVIKASQPVVDVKTQITGVLAADPDKQVFSVSGLNAKVNGEAAGVKALALGLRADIESRAADQKLQVAGLKLDVSGMIDKDTFNAKVSAPTIAMQADNLSAKDLAASVGGVLSGIAISEGNLRVPALAMNLSNQNIQVEGIALLVKGKREADNLEIKLDVPRLSVTREKASGADMTASLNLQGKDLAAIVNLKLTGVDGSAKALRIGQFALNVDVKQAENTIKGTLSTPIAVNLETRVFQLPRLAGAFDVASPSLPMKKLKVPLSGQVSADLGKQAVNADIATRLDESSIKAKIGLTDFSKQRTTFDIAIDKLNVDKYLPPKKAEAGKPAEKSQPEQPIDFSPLKKLDVAGSLRIADLIASNTKAQNLRVDIKARDGKLEVNPFTANLYQGSVNGSAMVNAIDNSLAVRQNLSGVAIGPLLRDAVSQDVLEGRGNIALDVTSAGNTVTAIKKALNGTAALSLKDGAIKGINLAQSLRNAKSLFSAGKRESEQAAAKGEKTDFSELTASFIIKNGAAHNSDLIAKSPFLRLTGEGDINIGEGSLNYLAKAAVVATSGGQGGKEMSDLKGLTVPVRASGPFDALKFKLEFGSAFSEAAKQQVEEQKEALKTRAEDKLKKLLGDDKGAAPPAAPPGGQPDAAPGQKPEDKLKQKLKKIF